MYKDKQKQREASRERQRRYKARQKALPEQGVTDKALPSVGLREHCAKVYAINFPKRGKDIKCFEDLPQDVQQTIDRISKDKEDKKARIERAINYHQQASVRTVSVWPFYEGIERPFCAETGGGEGDGLCG